MDRQPWERLKGETPAQFAYFNTYLLIPASQRNIMEAVRQHHKQLYLDSRPVPKSEKYWYDIAKKHNWIERVAAYDQEAQRKLLAAREDAAFAFQQKLINQRYLGHDRLLERMKYCDTQLEKVKDLPGVQVNEKKYRNDGTLEADRKIGRMPRSEIAQLLKMALEIEQGVQFGLDPKPAQTAPTGEGNTTGPATHLRLIVEDYVDPTDDSEDKR